uniref:non-specific serine/threonine protein kinase n=1 Tax=Gopherus evgoodei TaxID=1825980 RepID=A0A8C5F1Z3_9SAUR
TSSLTVSGVDLKLENLLLDKRENMKISDFGFSNPLSQTYCGSFAYACPEILLGLPYNPFLADTWSMGVILYTLAVAHLPFDDTNLKRLLRETQKEVVFPPQPPVSEACKVGGGQGTGLQASRGRCVARRESGSWPAGGAGGPDCGWADVYQGGWAVGG